jgi:RNA polymerase sigma factor (sigma-70 family)
MRERIRIRIRHGAELARELIAKEAARLARSLRHVPADAAVLSVSLDEGAERKPVRARASLRLPSRTLATQEEAERVDVAIRAVFGELERMLHRELLRLRGERAWLRRSEGARARIERALATRDRDREAAQAALAKLAPFVPEAERHVRTELRMLAASGAVAPGEIDPRDVVDAAVLRAVEDFAARPPEVSLRAWLVGLASAELNRQLQALAEEHATLIHLEEDVPETPAEEAVVTLGSEIYDFYQPDEDLRLEDVLPALDVVPPRAEEAPEVTAQVLEALAALPRSWRQAFLLRDVRGYDPAEIAWVTGADAAGVARRAERAAEFLRERLAERLRRA